MPRPARRQVVILLTREEWQTLLALALEDERDPFQQARWMLVKALRESETPRALDDEPERALTAS
jgi:hypothetical protein